MKTIEELPMVVLETISRITSYIEQYTDASEEELQVISTHLGIAFVLGYNMAPAFVNNMTVDQTPDIVNTFAEFYGDYLTKALEYRSSSHNVPYAIYYTICTSLMLITGFYESIREYCPDLMLSAEDFINAMDSGE